MRCHTQQRGMTLVELLVMMVIIAVSVGFILPQISWIRSQAPLRTEMNSFASLVELARDEAALQGRNFGVRFYPDNFELYELDPDTGGWLTVSNDDMLKGTQFSEDTIPALFVDDREVLLERPEDEDLPEPVADAFGELVQYAADVPHVVILASGEVTPFTLELNQLGGQESLQLNADVFGQMDIVDLAVR